MKFLSINLQGRMKLVLYVFFFFSTVLSLRRNVLDTTDLALSLYSDNQETFFKTGHELCSLAIGIFQVCEVHFGAIKLIRTFMKI